MSINGDTSIGTGFDATDHQAVYIYKPPTTSSEAPDRAAKRRKIDQQRTSRADLQEHETPLKFEPLLNGVENPDCVNLRQELFQKFWTHTEGRIQSVLSEVNEGILADVTSFIQKPIPAERAERVLTGFIVTGPNIASQGLLFKELSQRLKLEINGPVITLRSEDAFNLKATLKKLIRDATNQKAGADEEKVAAFQQDGQKLLNYDLELLHRFVNTHGSQKVVVAFQDSEAFGTSLVAELIVLFNSWADRIPFTLLFGIATSVELFAERLSRAATSCLYGVQFDVEQTNSVLERVFQKVIAGSNVPLRLGAGLVSSLVERQQDHVQSFQAFAAALKYAYMCHFYANPLSVLCDTTSSAKSTLKMIQPEHFEAIRMLPSFRKLIENLLECRKLTRAQELLENDDVLSKEIEMALISRDKVVSNLTRAMHLLFSVSTEPVGKINLYVTGFAGGLHDSEILRNALDSIKRMTPESLISFTQCLTDAVEKGRLALDFDTWHNENPQFVREVKDIQSQATLLAKAALETGKPIRSRYTIHTKVTRTTVIAQKVQLSQEKSTLSEQDKDFTDLIDRLLDAFGQYVTCDNPHQLFLNEIWLYDSKSPYRDVFTPRPRFAIERALSVPHDYLGCQCCKASLEGLSSSQPPTAILYQLYLETGSLINVFDLWSAFFAIVGGEDGEGCDERKALTLFYMALADLKSLGMVKQSKKKVDHIAKLAWKGI